MIDRSYAEYAWEQTKEMLAIDSPTGFTAKAALWLKEAFEKLGYPAHLTAKGGVIADLGGEGEGLMLAGHIDTIGAMVAQVKSNGRLKLTNLGGLHPTTMDGENVRLYTRDGAVLEGTVQLCNPSVHVNADHGVARTWDNMELVLDEFTTSAAETRALGVEVGDIVAPETRTRRTKNDYLKSRFLDDKLLIGILLAYAKYLADNKLTPNRKLWVHVTVYEEVGHGCAASLPEGVTEAISLDMGCVGNGLTGTERTVSICPRDAKGPYNYEVTGKLIAAAKAAGADYAVDIFPRYGSDVEAALLAGADVRHGLIGPGVYASHGYERSHMDGVYNTLKLLCGYLSC